MNRFKWTMVVAGLALAALLTSGIAPAGGQDGNDRGLEDADAPPSTGGDVGTDDRDEAGGGALDQQILDDLIVDGSACVGLDCVNGENFGFDTLRVKENNLRINFFDTSTSASFPSNDWRLTANDSANGGLNHFSIDDVTGGRTPFRIEAGAPSSSLYVESDGDIGIGTNNPVVETHIADGDSPTIRLEQNGTSGFTAQTWDVAGNEANFFVRDVSNGSRLPFKIRPGAPTGSIDVQADGTVKFGANATVGADGSVTGTSASFTNNVSNPFMIADLLTMSRNGGPFGMEWLDADSSHKWEMYMADSATPGEDQLRFNRDGTTVLILKSNGTVEIPGNLVVGSCTGC